MDNILFVYTTWPNAEGAELAARELVLARLAACANIMPAAKSFFFWNETLETATETVVIFKTTAHSFEALQAGITELHPYEVPCIVGLDVAAGHAGYLNWVKTQTI